MNAVGKQKFSHRLRFGVWRKIACEQERLCRDVLDGRIHRHDEDTISAGLKAHKDLGYISKFDRTCLEFPHETGNPTHAEVPFIAAELGERDVAGRDNFVN